ncbi:similar to transcription factor Cys6 [Botrytis cinerea T4]|uniref:Similar to transcription factor Cys6 n=1 Tax=Botryotinia fuckeliana (strain T4) TaxID=999810 RepID=G2YUJ7_BOTF4|nr:similar to transcription factor Cys6 [Botrytis cinerea T4]
MSIRRENGHGVVPRRRNGKQPACEPCRKAKISCDHGLPVCDRCKRRKSSAKCIYLSAPMTRRLPTEGSNTSREREQATGILSTPTPTPTPSVISTHDHLLSPDSRPTEPGRIQSGGFFGPTNFSAVFEENRENIGNDIQISNDSSALPSYDSLQTHNFLMLPGNTFGGSPRIQLGIKILQKLPDKRTCDHLLKWHLERMGGCSPHIPRQTPVQIAHSLWSQWGKELKEPRRLDDIESISTHLCRNSEHHLQEAEDYQPWLEGITGAHMRWESVGLIFAALCRCVLSLSERDAFFTTQPGQRKDRKHFAMELKDCIQACVTLSNYMDYINTVMVGLLTENLIITTVIMGDASLIVWRQIGDLVSMSTALGLHRQPDNDGPVTFLSECKRRLFTIIFNFDKSSAHLTGRPPALSYRYTRFRFPLDIDDEVFAQGPEALRNAAEKLDANGWNQEARMTNATYIRAHGYLTIITDEILELSLTGNISDTRITALLARVQETYDGFPFYTHYQPSNVYSPSISDDVLWRRIGLRLTYLEHRLTLERLAHKSLLLSGQSMISCALEMLQLTVLFWVQRDRFVEHHHDYDWMLMCWGVPSSGVLCVEILKQMKSPHESTIKLPTSEIVQNLSLLVGFFEWIKPSAGNYLLCRRMSKLVKRILDQILNHRVSGRGNSQGQGQEGERSGMGLVEDGNGGLGNENGNGNVDVGMMGVDDLDGMDDDVGTFGNLDWLNELDWSRGPWMNLDSLT